LAFLVSGCATDKAFRQKQARAFRDRGERYLAANQTSKALEQFSKALEIYPDDPILHYLLAIAYVDKRRFDEAESYLQEAIRLKPDYSDAYNYLGVLYFRKGEVVLAIESYQKALDNIYYMKPQDAHFNMGYAYLSRKEYRKAALHLERAIELVPNYVDAYNNLGKAYEGLGQYYKARFNYEKAVKFNPQYADAYLNLGRLLYRSGERQKATKALTEVIKLEPGSERAREAQRYLKRLQ
jgi:tetratricopeptide (TPR) repeat protein